MNQTFEKFSILFKVKSKISDFERGKTKILTLPIVIGTGIHTIKHFEGKNLSLTPLVPLFYPP